MTIGLDISQITYVGTGVARFTQGLFDSILKHDQKNNWIFFFSSFRRNLEPSIKKCLLVSQHKLVKMPFPPSLLSFFWNRLHILPIENFTGKLDWFISSDWTEPPAHCKKATVVHDLAFIRYPETVTKKILNVQKKRLHWIKDESRVIFADSQSTKNDLINLLQTSKDKITLNYPGVEVMHPDQTLINSTLSAFKLNKPYILTVGKIEPRKNLSCLIEIFGKLNRQDVDLVIVGAEGWGKVLSIDNKNPNVKFLGYVADEKLCALYAKSLFFVMPSLWEGFGYPAVEAMKLGIPVALSNTSSLKEIGENAAVFFDPLDSNSIEKALTKLLENATLRKEMSQKGLIQSQKFSWDRYYQTLIATLINNQ